MASTDTRNGAPTVDAAFEQVKELNGQFLVAARKAGTVYLDAYEKAIEQTTDLQLKAADMSRQEWLKNLIEKQAEFTRQITSSYVSGARSFLK